MATFQGPKRYQPLSTESLLKQVPPVEPPREWLSSYRFPLDSPPQLTRIFDRPGVFLSSNHGALDTAQLQALNIGTIFSLATVPGERAVVHLPGGRVFSNKSGYFRHLGITRYFCGFCDGASADESSMRTAYRLFTAALCKHGDGDKNILVHCTAGLSRSVSLVAVRAAKSLGCSFQEVVEVIASLKNVGIDEAIAEKFCRIAGVPIDKTSVAGLG